MATYAFVGLRQSLFSYSLALLTLLDNLRSLVSLTLHAALSKAALALAKIQGHPTRASDTVVMQNGKMAVVGSLTQLRKDSRGCLAGDSETPKKPQGVTDVMVQHGAEGPDPQELLAKLSATMERILDLRHKTSAMLHRKEEIMPAPWILKEVLPRVSSPKVLTPLPEERQLSLDMRKDEHLAAARLGQLEEASHSAHAAIGGRSNRSKAVAANPLCQERPLVTVERLGSSTGDETELRRESTKAMRAQEEQDTPPTGSTAATAPAAGDAMEGTPSAGPPAQKSAVAAAAALATEAPMTPTAAASRAPASKLGSAAGDAQQQPSRTADVAAAPAQPPGPADARPTESPSVTGVPAQVISSSELPVAAEAKPSPVSQVAVPGEPGRGLPVAQEVSHQPSQVPSSAIAEPGSSKQLPKTSSPSSMAPHGSSGRATTEAGFWGKLGHTLKKAFTPPESYD